MQYLIIFFIILWIHSTGGKVNQLIMVSMVMMQLNRPFEMIASSVRDFIIAKGMAEPTQVMLNNDDHKQNYPSQCIIYEGASQGTLSLE